MDRLLFDLRHAARSLSRDRGLTLAVLATLAITLGGLGAVFCLVDDVLLDPFPYRDADRLVAIFASVDDGASPRNPTSPANFLDWRRESGSLEAMTAAHPWSPILSGEGRPEQIPALKASPELFALLGAEAAIGRAFAPGDEATLVLSHELWQRRFAADPGIVSRTLTLDGEPYTVVGVMPPGFRFPPFWAIGVEAWAPLVFPPEKAAERGPSYLRVFARLRPGASVDGARAEMEAIATRQERDYPGDNRGRGVTLEPLKEPAVDGVRALLWVLFGGAGLVLAVAATNVAGLLASRGLARRRETAVRAALGAGRGRLVRHALVESLLLALAAGAAATLLAAWGAEGLARLGSAVLPRMEEVSFDGAALAFILAAAGVVGLLCGLAPALQGARRSLPRGLGTRSAAGGDGQRLRGALVTAQVALTVMLLVSAGLLARSFERAAAVDPGFYRVDLLTLDLGLAGSPSSEPAAQGPFFAELVERLERLPGVADAGVINHLPIGGDFWQTPFSVDGRSAAGELPPRASFKVVAPGTFDALGAELVAGRDFNAFDRSDGEPVVIVNQRLARRFLPADPLDARLRMGGPEPGAGEEPGWMRVVGVVGDMRQWGLTEEARPEIFFPYSQNPTAWWKNASLVVHTTGDPRALVETVKAEVWAVDGDAAFTRVRSAEEILSGELERQRLTAWLAGLFAAVAALLAAVGIFGLLSYRVASRRREIGVRVALGARRGSLLRLVLGHALALVGAGTVLGLAGALAGSRLLESLLYELSPTDPASFAGTALLLLAMAAAAAYVPARRALRADPAAVLREE